MTRAALLLLTLTIGLSSGHGLQAQAGSEAPRLVPTDHPALPAQASQFWFVPDEATRLAASRDAALARFVRGVKLVSAGELTAGLPLVREMALSTSPLASYAQFYTGVALTGLGRFDEADAALTTLANRNPVGYLHEATPLLRADVAASRGDAQKALAVLEDLSGAPMSAPEDVLLRLGRAAERAGDRDKALTALRRVYYEFPLSTQASDAESDIARLEASTPGASDRLKRDLVRAGRVFGARRWSDAREAFARLPRAAEDADRELVAIRLAECDYYLNRHRAARDGLRPYLDSGTHQAEARYFYLSATRALGDDTSYVTQARAFVNEFPDSDWAQEVLNNLGSYYLIANEDESAEQVFRELIRRYPKSRFAERAAWKAGWFAYRRGQYGLTVDLFEQAAADFPRADTRPAWLYWAGRARDLLGDAVTAEARFRLVVTDYQNSYYGRLAEKLIAGRRQPPVQQMVAIDRTGVRGGTVASEALIRALVAAQLYDQALQEIQYAQRIWGDAPVLQATFAWIRYQQGQSLKGTERFNALRGAINTMRRAYPQFMAAGGEELLPPELMRVIFPLDYWPLIKKYAEAQTLDPYLVAALMAQESTFTAEIRSSANAYGLMQLIPGTGRRYARKLGIRRFSTASLTNPETNVRLGTEYFADLVERFDGAHFALASYNAGESRVAQWLKASPGLPQDEFIDNIPFPETQTYVKRILGTAEDYRRLYGGGILTSESSQPPAARRTN